MVVDGGVTRTCCSLATTRPATTSMPPRLAFAVSCRASIRGFLTSCSQSMAFAFARLEAFIANFISLGIPSGEWLSVERFVISHRTGLMTFGSTRRRRNQFSLMLRHAFSVQRAQDLGPQGCLASYKRVRFGQPSVCTSVAHQHLATCNRGLDFWRIPVGERKLSGRNAQLTASLFGPRLSGPIPMTLSLRSATTRTLSMTLSMVCPIPRFASRPATIRSRGTLSRTGSDTTGAVSTSDRSQYRVIIFLARLHVPWGGSGWRHSSTVSVASPADARSEPGRTAAVRTPPDRARTGGPFVPERPRRLCIGRRAFLHPAGPAMHSAMGALALWRMRSSAGTPTDLELDTWIVAKPIARPALPRGRKG